MTTEETVHWTLHNHEVSIRCTGRDTSEGVELSLSCSGVPLARRLIPTASIAEERAHQLREEWEAAGWEHREKSQDVRI